VHGEFLGKLFPHFFESVVNVPCGFVVPSRQRRGHNNKVIALLGRLIGTRYLIAGRRISSGAPCGGFAATVSGAGLPTWLLAGPDTRTSIQYEIDQLKGVSTRLDSLAGQHPVMENESSASPEMS
jgi:hypothetical protein